MSSFADNEPSAFISNRGKSFIRGYPKFKAYIEAQMSFMKDMYNVESNPFGGIPGAIAENNLCRELLLEKISSFPKYELDVLNYTDPSGYPQLKTSLSNFLSSFIFRNFSVSTEDIVICTGVTALLQSLSLMLFNNGDGILIPTPYYPAFDPDFELLGNAVTVEVRIPCDSLALTVDALEEAYVRAMTNGCTPRALLLTNPNNPLGRIYSDAELMTAIAWCRTHHIHLISDEIYALSVFGDGVFNSVGTLLNGNLGDDVHILWGLSKDLGASGMRVGVLVSHNKQLLAAVKGCCMIMQVPAMVQAVAAHVLNDTDFIARYITENSMRLQSSYNILKEGLATVGVPLIPANSGLFAFADFRSLLPLLAAPSDLEGERALNGLMIQRGIVFTPGEVCHSVEAGFFRICYAWISVDAIREILRRIQSLISDLQHNSKSASCSS